jgi:large subunit ribosomal protein L10
MKENEKLVLKAGWLDGKILDVNGVKALATLPGKQELRGRLLSVVIGVPTAFVRVLTAGPAAFVRVLEARRQQLDA